MNKNKVTLKDIAQETGYSITTISHVINKTRHVDENTKKSVLKALKQLGYVQPKKHITSERSDKVIGVLIADIREDYFHDLLKSIEDCAKLNGYKIMICDSEQNKKLELEYIKLFIKKNVDGLILAPADPTSSYSILKENTIPTVLVDRNIDKGKFDYVGVDNFKSSYDAALSLVNKGCKKSCFIGYKDSVSTVKERKSGFMTAMLEHGSFNPNMIFQTKYSQKKSDSASIYKFLEENKFDGIVCANATICFEVIGCLEDLGLIGVNIITYDDNKWMKYIPQKISTITQPTGDIASTAIELLVQKIENLSLIDKNKKIILDCEFKDLT